MVFDVEYDIDEYLKINAEIFDDEYVAKIKWALKKCPNKFKQQVEDQLLDFIDEAIYEAIEELYYTELEASNG